MNYISHSNIELVNATSTMHIDDGSNRGQE